MASSFLAMPTRSASWPMYRPQVEIDHPPVGGDVLRLVVDDSDERRVRRADGLLEERLHARTGEQLVCRAHRQLAQGSCQRRGDRLQVLRQARAEILRDVGVRVDLVDEVDGELAPDLVVVEHLRAQVRDRIRVQCLPLDPDGHGRRETDQRRDDDQHHDCDPPPMPGVCFRPRRLRRRCGWCCGWCRGWRRCGGLAGAHLRPPCPVVWTATASRRARPPSRSLAHERVSRPRLLLDSPRVIPGMARHGPRDRPRSRGP